jgi:hypothetical protein
MATKEEFAEYTKTMGQLFTVGFLSMAKYLNKDEKEKVENIILSIMELNNTLEHPEVPYEVPYEKIVYQPKELKRLNSKKLAIVGKKLFREYLVN